MRAHYCYVTRHSGLVRIGAVIVQQSTVVRMRFLFVFTVFRTPLTCQMIADNSYEITVQGISQIDRNTPKLKFNLLPRSVVDTMPHLVAIIRNGEIISRNS
jgi:hypothetical protein